MYIWYDMTPKVSIDLSPIFVNLLSVLIIRVFISLFQLICISAHNNIEKN